MAYFDIYKGYRDYGTFIVHQFPAASGYTPAVGDVVTIDSNGAIAKATSGTNPIATGVVFEAGTPSVSAAGSYVVLLGQGVIETDNVGGTPLPAIGDYVQITDGQWEKQSTGLPSGIVIGTNGTNYIIYKFV